ncbi:hypothetical protein MTP02_41910 [Streptomyces albus]|nr:hypothetical protein MTP02_41910 [Streptomyces albus]
MDLGKGSGETESAVAAGGGEAVGLDEGGAGLLGAGRVVHDSRVEQRDHALSTEGDSSFGNRHVDGVAERGDRGGPLATGHGGAHRPRRLQELEGLRAIAVVLLEGADQRREVVQVAVGGGRVST